MKIQIQSLAFPLTAAVLDHKPPALRACKHQEPHFHHARGNMGRATIRA